MRGVLWTAVVLVILSMATPIACLPFVSGYDMRNTPLANIEVVSVAVAGQHVAYRSVMSFCAAGFLFGLVLLILYATRWHPDRRRSDSTEDG